MWIAQMLFRAILIGYVAAALGAYALASEAGWLAGGLVIWILGPCLSLLVAYSCFRWARHEKTERRPPASG
jgi:hypothetical protein